MITVLDNPMLDIYKSVKHYIKTATYMPWNFYTETCRTNPQDRPYYNTCGTTDTTFFSRNIISRPGMDTGKFSLPSATQEMCFNVTEMLSDMLACNGIKVGTFFRVNVNMTLSSHPHICWSPRHVDHAFPHKSCLIYLDTPTTGGQFEVWENTYDGKEQEPEWGKSEKIVTKEDMFIMFDGLHYHAGQSPTTIGEVRRCIVATFNEWV